MDEKERLSEEFEKYKHLITIPEQYDRIKFLCENPHIGKRIIGEWNMKPNCWGTTIFLVGQEEKVKEIYVKKTGNALDDYSDAMGDYVNIPTNELPGYVGEDPLVFFLEGKTNFVCAGEENIGGIVAFHWRDDHTESCGFRLRHAGIYLGDDGWNQIFFHQEKIGGEYGFISVQEYKRTIHPQSQKTFEANFYVSEKIRLPCLLSLFH